MSRRPSPLSMRSVPLLYGAAAFAVGVCLEGSVPSGWAIYALLAVLAPCLSWLFHRHRAAAAALTAAALSGVILGALASEPAPHRVSVLMDSGEVPHGSPVELTGRIVDGPEATPTGFVIEVAASEIRKGSRTLPSSGTVRVFAASDSPASAARYSGLGLGAGDTVTVMVRLQRDDRFLNPGVLRMRDRLEQTGADASASMKSAVQLRLLRRGGGFLRRVVSVKNLLIRSFLEHIRQPTSGVMIASLLGNRHFLDKESADLFRDGGVFHVLVISGLHITFMGGLVLMAVSRITADRRVQFAIASVCLWTYALAVGAEAPVLRAVVMFTVMLAGRLLWREVSGLNSLGFCALVLLAWRPADLFSPSFQLTFLSVGSLVGVGMPAIDRLRRIGAWTPSRSEPLPPRVAPSLKGFCETLYWNPERWRHESAGNVWSARLFKDPLMPQVSASLFRPALASAFEGLVLSTVVQAVLLPLQIYYFHRVATGGLLLNLWVGPILAVESLVSLLALAAHSMWTPAGRLLASATELLNYLLFSLPEVFASTGVSSVRVPLVRGFVVWAWLYLALVALLSLRLSEWSPFAHRLPGRLQDRWTPWMTAAVGTVLVLHPFLNDVPKGRLIVEFLDVGQGDSVFVTFPDGRTMLVDGGGKGPAFGQREDGPRRDFEPDRPDVGESVVSEFLWERGISRIDFVLATHADSDHMQGLSAVVRNFSVGGVLIGRFADGDPDFDDLEAELRKKGLAAELVASGFEMEVGGATVAFLAPDPDGRRGAPSGNRESVVTAITFGSRRFLLMGDLEGEGERRLVRSGSLLRSDVVKAGHHGSRTSSVAGFVARTAPAYVVVSVGRESPFGHPHAEVLERWEAVGARVLRTGERGTVSISTDGRELRIGTFLGQSK